MKLAAYLRVSTDRQADEGFGLDVQEAALRSWARASHHRLAALCVDAGRSGAADVVDRPGLADALGHLKAGRVDGIVVARLDRLARDLVLQEWLRAEILKLGGTLHSTSAFEEIHLADDPDDPTGRLVRRILGAIADYERSMIALRMAAGKRAKARAGGYVGGQPPYGYQAAGRELVPRADEQAELRRMRRWRRAGWSWRAIADQLTDEGVPARRGSWHPQTVARIVDRPRSHRSRNTA